MQSPKDSYDAAKELLDVLTMEGGWYVYCFEEEEWQLYNEDEILIKRSKRIENLLPNSEDLKNQ